MPPMVDSSLSPRTRRTEPPVSKPAPLGPGTIVADRYEVRPSLGKGGMGEVVLAFDRPTQETVALKVVREAHRMPGDDA